MSNEIDPSEWPYDEFGSYRRAKMDIERIFSEAKWESDYFEDEDEWEEWRNEKLDLIRDCTCNPDKIFSAAQDLLGYFAQHGGRFPRTMAQMDSFGSPGGWAHGSWSMYINVPSSIPYELGETGSIHLFGCLLSGHGCRVVMDDALTPTIKGSKATFVLPSLPSISHDNEDAEISEEEFEEAKEAVREIKEEYEYDERTFGALEKDIEDDEEDGPEKEAIRQWQEEAFPPHEVNAYLEAGLELEEVISLSRLMPLSEVALWAEEFGAHSMQALDFLRVGLGDMPLTEEVVNFNLDDFRVDMAGAIRSAITEQFGKRKNDLRIIDKKSKKDDYESDFDDDLDLYDDFDDDEVFDDFRDSREVRDFLNKNDGFV
jgi:hypothetical protein